MRHDVLVREDRFILNPTLNGRALRATFDGARPYPHVVIDRFLDEGVARELAASLPSFEQALAQGRSFRAVNERNKVQVTDAARFPPPVARLHDFLSSDAFLHFLTDLTGIDDLRADPELVGGGLHQTGPRGRLDVHVDFNRIEERAWFRRLNLLLYLNEEWRPEWGGELELWDREVRVCHRSVRPALNTCVIFETSEFSFHGVRPVTCPQGHARRSFAAYYYTVRPPAGWGGHDHSTLFRARPDELFRGRVLMPLERQGRELRETARRIGRRVRRLLRGGDTGAR